MDWRTRDLLTNGMTQNPDHEQVIRALAALVIEQDRQIQFLLKNVAELAEWSHEAQRQINAHGDRISTLSKKVFALEVKAEK